MTTLSQPNPSFPTASEVITTLATWNLREIVAILKELSIFTNFEKKHTQPMNSSDISPLLFQLSTAETLHSLLTKHSVSSNVDIMELDDLDLLLNLYTDTVRNKSTNESITNFLLFLVYCRYFHSHFVNPYLPHKYDNILDEFDKNSVSTYLLDISGNFEPFVSVLFNHRIRFQKSETNTVLNSQFITPLNAIIDFEFEIKQSLLSPMECIDRVSSQTTKGTTHRFMVLLYHYSSFDNDATLMTPQRLNPNKVMYIVSDLCAFLFDFALKTDNKYLVYFIVERALFIILKYIRCKCSVSVQKTNAKNTLDLNECKRIFAYLFADKNAILNTNLYALIFMIASHSLISKLIKWNLTDYSSLEGHKQRMKQMSSTQKTVMNDIGYVFESCLNNGYFGRLSIFNHTLNIPKYAITQYLNQCILYLIPYTFSVHEFMDILLRNINIPMCDVSFDENFFVSYCVLFRNIAESMDKIIKPNMSDPLQCFKSIQKLCLNDIIISLSELKQELKFEKNELFFIGYICALCGLLSTKKDILLIEHNTEHKQFTETEKTLNTEIQTEVSHIIGKIQSLQNQNNDSNTFRVSWIKSIMSAMAILCNFNRYFLRTDYLQTRSFYFMDFMFDALLQSLVDLVSNKNKNNIKKSKELFVSYLNHSSYTISKLMQITHENITNFTKEDVNAQQFKMVKDLQKYITNYIWEKDGETLGNNAHKNVIWYCLTQILHQFSLNYSDTYPTQMVSVSTATVQIEHISFPNPMRSQLINTISTAIKNFANEILIPFLETITMVTFENVTDKKCEITIPKAYQARDAIIIHLLSDCMDAISEKPTILYSYIIPYFHLYGNNALVTEKDIISRVHYLYSMTVKHLSLRWAYFNVPNRLYPSDIYDSYYVYYFEKLLIANFTKSVDFPTLSQSFNVTFSFAIKQTKKRGSDSESESYSKLGNVVFNTNNELTHFNGESMPDVFNQICMAVLGKLVSYVLDNLSIRYQFGETITNVAGFEQMIVNVCKMVMVCACMDNMIKLGDLNYALFLCQKLFGISSGNNINTQNKQLMRKILSMYADIIANCNNLTRKDHCLKWYFALTEDIQWSSKL